MKQRQFLEVINEDEARRRFDEATAHLTPALETVPLAAAHGRVLARDVHAPRDVPGFDRSNVDGFAVRAADSFGATELEPVHLAPSSVQLAAGKPRQAAAAEPGGAVPIATGAVLPRGADAVVMVEDTAPEAGGALAVFRPVAPGENVSGAGTDLARGEVVLAAGAELSSRETGLLAAVGVAEVDLVRRPRVAVLSTGDEVRPPGAPLEVGEIHDSNGRILCDAATELGGEARHLGILPDDEERLTEALRAALVGDEAADVILLSGGTSKGAGDLNARVVERLAAELDDSPGILVHGVALKPGKPLCLAVVAGRPIAILPGFPTSAIFTFHEFVAPLVRRLAGRRADRRGLVEAVAPVRIPSAPGRTEYCLVDLVPGAAGLAAYPLGSGSGSVRTFSRADGFLHIGRHEEYVPAGARVHVRPLGAEVRSADLIAIGSHCVGLDRLLSLLGAGGLRTKMIPVGSRGGLDALARGEGDVAGTHLLDEESGVYNLPLLPAGVAVLGGYGRRQGLVFRPGDERFEGRALDELRAAVALPGVRMVNRNPGSGTRVLLDRFLGATRGEEPDGYHLQARSHHAVAAAVAQERADWGFTLDSLAAQNGLAFVFVQEERFDVVARDERRERPAVRALAELLRSPEGARALRGQGLVPDAD
ncbi:MAG: molybdopterin biosynthesis protein [Planctomycetota bacterium]